MFSLFKKQKESSDFWQWLRANTSRIQSGDRKAVGTIPGEISVAFKKFYPSLVWEITPKMTGPWIFSISADGNRDLFDQVRAVTAAAPPISGWEIVAFRQRGSLDVTLDINGQTLDYDDIWCTVEPVGSQARVTLHIRRLAQTSSEQILGASLVLLDNAIGEYDAVMKILDLNNAPLPAHLTKSDTFFPLRELPAYLDRLGG